MSTLKSFLKQVPIFRQAGYQFIFWLRGNKVNEEGRGNVVNTEGASVERCSFYFYGHNNKVIIKPGASVKDCEIRMYGHGHTLLIDENAILTQSLFWFEDHDCQISIGSHTTMQRYGHIAVTEPGRKIEIGSRCMFSFNVDIRNGDSHSILDIESGQRVNWAKNIKIGSHVWLGAYTQVLGGSEIGQNAIVGIRSLVNGSIPENSIAVGIPARVAKRGFTWDSERILEGDPGA